MCLRKEMTVHRFTQILRECGILLATMLVALVLWPTQSRSQQFQFQQLSVADGLAQSQVYALMEDRLGYVWMATRGGGVSRFDGERFETFTTREGLRSNYIWCFAEDGLGRVWIGTDKGLNVFSDGRMESVNQPWASGSILSLHFQSSDESADRMFIGTYDFVHQIEIAPNGSWKGSNVVSTPMKTAMVFLSTAETSDASTHQQRRLLVGGDFGLRDLRDSSFHYLDDVPVRALAEDSSGGIWVGTYGRGTWYLNDSGLMDLSEVLGLHNDMVHAIYGDARGDIWFGTQQRGICRFSTRTGSVEWLTERQGLANNHIRAMMRDRWGNLWIGTSGGGVNKYTGDRFRYHSTLSGLRGNYIYFVGEWEGAVLVSSSGPGLQRLQDGNFVLDTLLAEELTHNIRSVLHAADCRLWVGTDGGGLLLVDQDSAIRYTVRDGLGSNFIRDLKEDASGRIWVATSGGGIARITTSDTTGAIIDLIGQSEGTGSRINDLHIDQWGRLWYASASNGVGYIIGDHVMRKWTAELPSAEVNAICEDAFGSLWIGTAGNGVARMSMYGDSIRMHALGTADGLRSDVCYQLLTDDQGHVWVGSEKGLDRLRIGEFTEDGGVLEIDHFGLEEGFKGVETTLNASFMDGGGHLWFGSINGLMEYVGQDQDISVPLPVLHIHSWQVNNTPLKKMDGLWLSHDSNTIAIGYRAISQVRAEDVVYQWRLIGLSDQWSASSKDRNVTFSNLSPGRYRFEIRASTDGQYWTPVEVLTFGIRTPFWEEWWFVVSTSLFATLLILTLALWQWRIWKKRAQKRENALKLEKQVLELEQKALRLQMNPHFIFHALNSIQALVSSNDSKTARYYLAKFSKLMRQILESSRKPSISLAHELETLQNYLSIEQFCHEQRFDFLINVAEEIDAEAIEIPPIILQPFVENAVIHGVAGLKDHGRITIEISRSGDYLWCIIEDNGIGRAAATQLRSQMEQKHKSAALLITQERLDLFNQEGESASIVIEDLFDGSGNATGTRVKVRIKIKSAE